MKREITNAIRDLAYGICMISTVSWVVVGIIAVWESGSQEWFLTFLLVSVASLIVLGATHYAKALGGHGSGDES